MPSPEWLAKMDRHVQFLQTAYPSHKWRYQEKLYSIDCQWCGLSSLTPWSTCHPTNPSKRDYQMSKVYKAERKWWNEFGGLSHWPELSLEEIETLARKMVPERPVQIRDGRGHRRATGGIVGIWAQLTMPRWSRVLPIVCHEAAHALAGNRVGHGPEFCRKYIKLVRDFIGPEHAARLVHHFQACRVIVSQAQEDHRNLRLRRRMGL